MHTGTRGMTGQLAETISVKLDAFIDWAGRQVSWLVLLMVLVTFSVVVLRYLFDIGWIALQESVSFMHSAVFLLGAAYTLKHNAHVRVDIIYSHLSPRYQALIDLIGHLFILLPVVLFIAWISWPYVVDAWQVRESSREAGGLPGIYLLKSLILVMCALLVIQAVALCVRQILILVRGSDAGVQG